MLNQDLHNQLRLSPNFGGSIQVDVRSRDTLDHRPKSPVVVNVPNQQPQQPDPQAAQEVDLVLLKDKPMLKKIKKSGSTSYKYTGPVNHRIQDFLEDLYRREGPIIHRGPFEKLINLNTMIDKRLEKIFPKSCTNGPLSLDKDSILLFLAMMAGAIYYATEIDSATEGMTDDAMQILKIYGTLYTFLFVIYGIVFLSLPIWWAFTVFVIQTTIPVFLILFDLNLIFPRDDVPSVDYTNTAVRACVAILPVYWGIMYPPYKLIRQHIGRFVAHVFIAVMFLGIVIFALGVPALDLLTGKETLDADYVENHSSTIYIVSAIVLVLSWIIAHMKYFWVPTRVLENTLMEMAQRQARKEINSKSTDKSVDVVREGLIAVPTMKQRIMRNIYWISSFFVGGIYIGLEMFLLDSIIKTIEADSTDGLVMSITFFAMTPLFLLVGIPIAMTKARVRNKTLFLPLIIMLPMFGVIPLSATLEDNTSTSNVSLFLVVGLPLMMFFWLGMAFLGLKWRRMFYTVLTFMCLFFFLPFVFLGLSESDYFAEVAESFKAVFYSFIGFFGFVTLILLSVRLVKALHAYTKRKINERKKRQQKEKENRERINALRKKRKERGELGDDDEDDDELQLEELERNDHGFGGSESNRRKSRFFGSKSRTSIHPSPSKGDVEAKKKSGIFSSPSKSVLDSDKGSKVKVSQNALPNEEGDSPEIAAINEEDDHNTEKKAKKQLNLLKEVETKKRLQLVKLMYLNFKNFGFWINAAAFIVSYTFVAYTYFNLPSSSTATETGVLLGVTIVMPIIFVLNNLLIRLKTAKLSAEERKVYSNKKDDERVFFESQLKKDEIRLNKATIFETYALMMGVLVIPLCQLPLFIVFTERKALVTNLFVMIVSIVFSIFLAGMIEIKKRTGPYNRFFIPSFVSLCWIMVLLPFVVIIPLVATVLENDSDDFKIFVKASLTGSAFLLMFGVTFFAIVINVIFQKLEKEKLIKFIIKTLQRTLKENSIKADDVVLRRLVEDFLNKDTEEEVEEFKKAIIYDKIPLVPIYPPKFKVTPLYGAGIILVETYNKILRAQQTKKKDKNPKKKKEDMTRLNLFAWLAEWCTDKDDEDEQKAIEDNFDDDKVSEIVGDMEDSYFKADHYLPKDLDENVWNHALGSVTPDMVRHAAHLTEEDEVPDDYHPVLGLKPTEVDYNLKDAMTPVLKTIQIKTLSSGEIRKLNNNEHSLIIHDSMNQMEVWYQHVYDYFSGKTDPDLQNPSQGLIYQNFLQFLRITELNQNNEVPEKQLQSTFALHATKKAEKGCCLAYSGFVQLLTLVASKAVLESDDSKLLRRFTKKIYPAIMSRIPQIAKSYSGAIISFSKSKTPYVPHLDLFDKTKIVSIHQDIADMSANDYVLKRREVRKSNAHIMRQINEEPPAAIPLSNLILRTSPTPKGRDMMSNESFFSHADRSPQLKGKKKKSCVKRVFRKMFLSLNACWISFVKKFNACIDACFVRYPKTFGDWVYRKTKRVGKALGFDIDVESDDDELAIRKVGTEAPSWPIVVDKMFSIIPKAQILYFQMQGQKGVTLQFNLTNLIAVVGKISEIYGFMAFAFRTEIPWFEDDLPSDIILSTNVEVSVLNSFVFLFWTAFGLVMLYLAVSIPAIYHLRKGTLGVDEQGKKASFPHPQFFITFGVTLLGSSLFTQIMRFLLEAFVCDYTTTPWSLVKDSSIECLSDEHSLYMGMGILALLIYYPISTFMFPNFQFQSKPLDLKYDPTYLVIQIQARLIITGFITFFKVNDSSDTASIITQLIGTSSTLFLLAIASLALKPCLIAKANIWDAGGYSAAAWVNICAIVVVVLRNSIVGVIMLATGSLAIVALTFYIIKKYYGSKSKKKKDLLGYVKYDPVKRQALIPEEYKPPQPIEPQPIVQPQGQFLKPPQPEEVRKRDLSVLDHLQSDVSLAYVDKKKHIF